MRIIIPYLFIFFLPLIGFSQIKTVEYSGAKNQLNGGLPLPSEEIFNIQGRIPSSVRLVTMDIYRSRKSDNSGNSYKWKTPYLQESELFELFITNPLRSNENYSLTMKYYERASSEDMQELKESILNNLEAYIRANYEVSRRGLQTMSSQRVMMTQLNQILFQGVANYTHPLDQEFIGFSDVVRQKIEQTHNLRLRNAKFNILRRKDDDSRDEAIYASQLIDELVALTQAEADQYLRSNLLMLVEIINIDNFPTEKRPNYLPINVGYAGAYFGGDFNNFDYGTSPYVGIAVPLGRKAFTKFLGNASLSTGIFTNNMTNSDGVSISGPLIGRPSYIGLGYSMFQILRFNAGAVLTSSEVNNSSLENITLYPFIGFSLEFNLWLGLNK
ncbi:hypothetical protein [Lunatibacter salilacus]|uniref:hypothetical protein n=1 Tax=Lunatibacter salilacus TaxID=2483804 RepID=UPI00131CA26D|nr:hypothetical protein [Lunatibacter salilacus]